jgi:hypothetical protein
MVDETIPNLMKEHLDSALMPPPEIPPNTNSKKKTKKTNL